MRTRRFGAMCAFLTLSAVTACGGGSSSPAPIPSPTSAPVFTAFPSAVNTVCVTPSTSGQTQPIPSTGGVTGSISFGAFDPTATGCDAVSIATGSDVVTTASAARRIADARTPLSATAPVPLLTISFGAAFGTSPSFAYNTVVTGMTLNVPASAHFPDGTYYATITPTSLAPIAFTASGGILTVASSNALPLYFSPSIQYVLSLYPLGVNPNSTPTPSPTPTAASSPSPSASASPSPSPSPTAVAAVYPLVVGETFTYQYSLTSVKTAASGTQTSYNTYVGPITAQLNGIGNYNGNQAYSLHTQGTTTNGNAMLDNLEYINLVNVGGKSEYVEYGYNLQQTYSLGNSVIEQDNTALSYGTPLILDMLPETTGATWAQPVAISETVNDFYTTSQNNPNILSGTLNRNADGSYTATGLVTNVPTQRQVNANGTGVLIQGPSNAPQTDNFGLPQAGASGNVIPVSNSYAGITGTNLVPDWYPGNAQPTIPLATSQSTNLGQGPAPSTCGTKAGTASTHIQFTYSQLDPVVGSVESEVTDYYVVPGVGFVCKLDVDTIRTFENTVTGALLNTVVRTSSQVLTSYVP